MPKKYVVREVNKKPTDGKYAHWSDKQRYQAVTLYKLTGNMSAVGRTLGIPLNTLFVWRKSKWWGQYEDDLLAEKKALTHGALEKLAQKAAEITQDRLENGDWVYINGELRRKPVNALTANKILQDSLERQVTLEEHYDTQKKQENELQLQERLKLVMDSMISFAKSGDLRVAGKGGDPNILEGELVDEKVPEVSNGEAPDGVREEIGVQRQDP